MLTCGASDFPAVLILSSESFFSFSSLGGLVNKKLKLGALVLPTGDCRENPPLGDLGKRSHPLFRRTTSSANTIDSRHFLVAVSTPSHLRVLKDHGYSVRCFVLRARQIAGGVGDMSLGV